MVNQFVTKLYKQRTSTVTSVPVAVKQQLKLKKGDYLVWQVENNSNFVQISKVVTGGENLERG